MSTSAALYDLESIVERLDPGKLFPATQPLDVELGSGDGSFLVAYAKAHPERNFVAVERLLGRVRKLHRKARSAELRNLRVIRIESAYFLEYLLPPGCAHAVHLYFPDPWPKRRHHRHRLVNERFPTLLAQVLAPGGRVYLRTDNPEYFNQMLQVFSSAPRFRPTATPGELLEVKTDFERAFNAQGIPTLSAAYEAQT